MRIATWNINSVRLRIAHVLRFIKEQNIDVMCLQETKTQDNSFPTENFLKVGMKYQYFIGEKSYNGVAILSKVKFDKNGYKNWCNKGDCRHISVILGEEVELHNFYVPAGGDIPDPKQNEKFAHKLRFLDEVTTWFAARKAAANKFVLVGDLNIAPLETDVWSHKALVNVVSHTPIEVERLARMQRSHDWVDAVRQVFGDDKTLYSWWSYRAADWDAADKGRRLDHVWVTPALAPRVRDAAILREARGWQQTSDHVPVVVRLK